MTFGDKIRDARKQSKLTQKQLADLLGAAHNSVSDWECNKNKPDPDTIELLCGILKITPNYLLASSDEEFSPAEKKIIKKYRFISECSTDGTKVVDAVLDREYSIAERLKALDEEIKKLKSDNSLKNVHNLNVSTEKEKELARFSKYVDEGADYVNAAHPIEGTLDEDKQFDEDIMDGEDF